MRVFLDTEFTDFTNPRLISFGLAAENGQELYAELSDGWTLDQCSDFVIDAVLPLLGDVAEATMTRDVAGRRLIDWLVALGSAVTLIHDSDVDWHLVAAIVLPYRSEATAIEPMILSWPGFSMARRYDDLVEEIFANEPRRHHALADARAFRLAVLQTEREFRE